MKKRFIYRHLKNDTVDYYQLYKIVDNDYDLGNIKEEQDAANEEFFYKNVEYSDDVDLDDFLYMIFYYKDGVLSVFNEVTRIADIRKLFYDKYKDFELIPKNTFDVEKLSEILNEKVKYQEKAIEELLNIIKSNLDILDSSLDDNQKRRMIHNILLYGPSGFGKSSIIETLIKNISVPCTMIELTSDPNKNITLVVDGLVKSALGNMKYAENGIVFIKDNFSELEEMDEALEINPLLVLEELLRNQYAIAGGENAVYFDLSKLTYVVEKTTQTEEVNDLFAEGFTDFLYNQFNNIICVSSLEDEEIKDIILNDAESIINLYGEVLSKIGKKLIVEDDFLDYLIEKTSYDRGGIRLLYNYIESMIKARWSQKTIILNQQIVDDEVVDLRQYFDDNVSEEEENEETVKQTEESKDDVLEKEEEFKIDLKAVREDYKDKLEELLKYIKGQDEPLKGILYHIFINDLIQNSNLPIERKKERIDHLLIRGGTGSGKSFITEMIAKSFNKPYAVVDCKRYTEAGYIGKSIDDMLIKLYNASGCDLQKAQKGILILDEFDKLSRRNEGGSDVGRGGVQESLLKMLEGTIFDLEIKNGPYTETINFDTRELTIVCAGAFEGLDKIRDERLKIGTKKRTVGFGEVNPPKTEVIVDKRFTLEDMQNYGIDAQLLRRIPFQCDLNVLTKDSYKSIMLDSKSSSFLIKIERLEMLGVKVEYNEEFVDTFVDEASKLGFGASSIAVLTDRIFAEIESKIMLGNYEKVFLTKECVLEPKKIILVLPQEKTLKKQMR